MKIIFARHQHDTESCRRLQPRSVLGSLGVALMSCKVNFHVVRSAWPHWYIFDDRVFFWSYVLQHIRLRSFAVNVQLVFQIFFSLIIFSEVQWTVIPNVKSSKYLIAMRKILLLDFFSYTCHHFANHLRFFEKWSRDISRDLETQNFYFILLRTMSTLFVQNFDSTHYPLWRS